MRPELEHDAVLVRYLLGNLPDDEQIKVEDRAFADRQYLAALEAAEADLIDAYVHGDLSANERRDFERRFLASPQRAGRVEFARALARVAAESKDDLPAPARRNWFGGWNSLFQLAATAAAVIIAIAATWLVASTAMRSRIEATEASRRNLQIQQEALRKQLAEATAQAGTPAPVIAALILPPGISRSAANRRELVLDSSAQLARIEIPLERRDQYPSFRIELRTAGGEEILTAANVRAHRTGASRSVTLDVPASALPSGEYELALKGSAGGRRFDEIGYYYFRVRNK